MEKWCKATKEVKLKAARKSVTKRIVLKVSETFPNTY